MATGPLPPGPPSAAPSSMPRRVALGAAATVGVAAPALAQTAQAQAPAQPAARSAARSRLLTVENCAIALVDHQPAVAFPIQSIDRRELVNNSTALTKTAKAFGVPLVLSTIREDASGPLFQEILAAAGDTPVVKRPARRNAWGDPDFVRAVEATGRRKLVMAGLWTEVCLALTTASAIEAGYDVYIVVDASGGTTKEAHDLAVTRMVQAGAVPATWLQVNRELLDAAQTPRNTAAVREIDKAHAGALGLIWEMADVNAARAASGGG